MLEAHESEAIVEYYRELDASFEHWGGPGAYAMHYGFKEAHEDDHPASLARMDAVVAECAKLRSGDVVLDAGCGVGESSLWLAAHHDVHVHGISLSPLQIVKARRLAREHGLARRARFSARDYTATGFAAGSFDVVWALESFCHAPRKAEFVREAHRILAPAGRLVVADYFRPEPALEPEDEAILRAWADGWVMALPPARDAFLELIERSGFVGTRVADLTDAIRADASEMDRRGREGLAEDLRSASPRRLAHVQACMAQKVALDLGLWRYLVVTAER